MKITKKVMKQLIQCDKLGMPYKDYFDVDYDLVPALVAKILELEDELTKKKNREEHEHT